MRSEQLSEVGHIAVYSMSYRAGKSSAKRTLGHMQQMSTEMVMEIYSQAIRHTKQSTSADASPVVTSMASEDYDCNLRQGTMELLRTHHGGHPGAVPGPNTPPLGLVPNPPLGGQSTRAGKFCCPI